MSGIYERVKIIREIADTLHRVISATGSLENSIKECVVRFYEDEQGCSVGLKFYIHDYGFIASLSALEIIKKATGADEIYFTAVDDKVMNVELIFYEGGGE